MTVLCFTYTPMSECDKSMLILQYKKYLTLIIVIWQLLGCDSRQADTLDYDRRLTAQELKNLTLNPPSDSSTYYFGFDLRAGPKEDAKQYLPFLGYLSEQTGYTFKLRFTPKDGAIVKDIGLGTIHFAAIGAVSYIQANKRYGVKPLVRGVNHDGKDQYRSTFVVRPASRIEQPKDIFGKHFAFGSKTSTQGHLIPRIVFYKKGIRLSDFKDYVFTGSHINCANSVLLNKTDVCGMQDVMAEDFAQQGKLRIIYRSDWYPSSGIVVNSRVPEAVSNKVMAALLAFDPTGLHAKQLYNWHKTEMAMGFVRARDQDYNVLRKWLKTLQIKEFQ